MIDIQVLKASLKNHKINVPDGCVILMVPLISEYMHQNKTITDITGAIAFIWGYIEAEME